MKKMQFKVPLYDVTVRLYQVEGKEDAPAVRNVLRSLGCSNETKEEIVGGIERDAVDGGETLRNMRKRLIVLVFYRCSSEDERAEVYAHEKRYVEDRILEYFGVKDIESAGLLAGWLGVRFRKFGRL